jgi:hypothetical protein
MEAEILGATDDSAAGVAQLRTQQPGDRLLVNRSNRCPIMRTYPTTTKFFSLLLSLPVPPSLSLSLSSL